MGNSNSDQTQNQSNVSSPLNPTPPRRFMVNDESTEQFILIWLDGDCEKNSLDTFRTKVLFQQLNDRCLFFNNIDLFLIEINKLKNENKKMLVVVSGGFVKEIPRETKEILSSIIIFCRNDEKYKYLLKDNLNIIGICTEYETLKNCIQNELPSLKFNLFANQKLSSLRSLNDSSNNTYFLYMLFINFLRKMPQTKQAKDIMLNKCKDYYRGNNSYLKSIEVFRKEYTPNNAINWYTEDSFVYRLVNRAFRTEDVTLWYLFRFYIIDLCTEIENVHKKQNIQSNLTLYRGQGHLATKELINLQSNVGGLVSTNGFLSASKDITVARGFMLGSINSDEFKSVLFQITLDAKNLRNIIFVDINQYFEISDNAGECEILFNIGSVFQVESVNYDTDLETWKIEMRATDEGTHSIKERIDMMGKKFENGNINLLFGRLLLDMEQYTKAKSYFKMMLHILPKSHTDLGYVYEHLGNLNMQITNWNKAFKNFESAYEIKKKKLPLNHPDIGITLNNLGNYYKAIGDHEQALEYYENALICKNNQYNRAVTLLNISSIYMIKKEYQNAFDLSTKAREIFEEYSSSSYIPIIQCQGIIGSIYLAQKDYDIAEEFYLTAFDMSKKYLFVDHRYRITCIKALANLYNEQNLKEKAIEFCYEQLEYYQQYLTENHLNIAYLLMIIGELYDDNNEEKINSLEKALSILEENIHLQYAMAAECLMMIGKLLSKNKIRMIERNYII